MIASEREFYNPDGNILWMTKRRYCASPEVYPVLRCAVVNNALPIRRVDEAFIRIQILGSLRGALCAERPIVRGFYLFS